MQIYAAEPLVSFLSLLEFQIDIARLKKYKFPSIVKIPAESDSIKEVNH
jgi:hypothetical protein